MQGELPVTFAHLGSGLFSGSSSRFTVATLASPSTSTIVLPYTRNCRRGLDIGSSKSSHRTFVAMCDLPSWEKEMKNDGYQSWGLSCASLS